MTPTGIFIQKQMSRLRTKYARRTISSFFHREYKPDQINEVSIIERQFLNYIETPKQRIR